MALNASRLLFHSERAGSRAKACHGAAAVNFGHAARRASHQRGSSPISLRAVLPACSSTHTVARRGISTTSRPRLCAIRNCSGNRPKSVSVRRKSSDDEMVSPAQEGVPVTTKQSKPPTTPTTATPPEERRQRKPLSKAALAARDALNGQSTETHWVDPLYSRTLKERARQSHADEAGREDQAGYYATLGQLDNADGASLKPSARRTPFAYALTATEDPSGEHYLEDHETQDSGRSPIIYTGRGVHLGPMAKHTQFNEVREQRVREKGPWGDYRPKRIILLRHGESMGNVDAQLYATLADNALPLTQKGHGQAYRAGKVLKDIVGNESVFFYVSPYLRTKETFAEIAKSFDESKYKWREEPRLREQDFGNYQDLARMAKARNERIKFGSFYYRFPQGESGADVYDRVSTLLESLHREWTRPNAPQNFVMISHGLTCRLLLMRYYYWEVEHFQALWNLDHCSIVQISRNDHGLYDLLTPLKMSRNKEERPPPKTMTD